MHVRPLPASPPRLAQHLTIASVNLGHGGAQSTGVYHSTYDSYDFYTKYSDPGFRYGVAQAAAFGVAVTRMADAPLLPFSFRDAAATFATYRSEIQELADDKLGNGHLALGGVQAHSVGPTRFHGMG